jgi:hypothetical protein
MPYSYSNTPLYVSEGDYIQFRFQAPPFWDYTETITVRIGELLQFWLITTVPEDFTPDPYPFQRVLNAELDTLYTYADGTRTGETITTVTGLTPTTQAAVGLSCNISGGIDVYACRIDYNGDGNWDTDWIQPNTSSGITVENGAKLQIRAKTQSFSNIQTRVTLLIGTSNEVWRVQTKPIPVNAPDPFPDFDDLTNQPTNTYIYSNILQVSGMNSDGLVALDNAAEFAISNTNTTFTDENGFDVLSGATFSSTPSSISNGQYLQLRLLSPTTPNTLTNVSVSVGDVSGGSSWGVTTGLNPSTNPDSFFFPDVVDALEDALIASSPRPSGGLTGLGTSVPVTLVSTTSSEVKIKINNGSIGVFPATVQNGDIITLYAKSSADFSSTVETQIKVGGRLIPTWQVTTSSGPDYDATFIRPNDRNNVVPANYISSTPVTVTGINRPITITATNGALISIDYDTPVVGPRTFDPTVNSTFYLVLFSSANLLTSTSTTVVVGTEASNVPAVTFTWTVTTYATAPPPSADRGVWYSRKTEKFDGYPLGTVIPVLKEAISSGYGDLGGDLGSRYAGFIECDGRSVSGSQYWALWEVIGNQYGGNVTKTFEDIIVDGIVIGKNTVYNGDFNLPDYRNRRLCGTGFVDSTRGNSAFLPVSTVGKGIYDVGSEGGYWYFDKVDVSGSQPLEQVEGSGTTGIDSQFFSLGTVRLTGLDTMVAEVNFTITGSVTGLVGPLTDVLVNIPTHDHFYISAVVDGDDGDPLMPWGTGRALFRFQDAAFDVSGDYGGSPSDKFNTEIGGKDTVNQDTYYEFWEKFIDEYIGTDFWGELRIYNPEWRNKERFIDQLPQPSTQLAPQTQEVELQFLTWWTSPPEVLDAPVNDGRLIVVDDGPLGGQAGNPNREMSAVIDTNPAKFTVQSYLVPGGQTLTHSHAITISPVNDPNTDYTAGNVSGTGIIGGGVGSGLGGAASNLQIVFTQSDVFMDMTEGEVKVLTSIKRPTPDVALSPQRQVPIMIPFHKTKYLIKAY